jgi:ADP-ribose pyrophosphatase
MRKTLTPWKILHSEVLLEHLPWLKVLSQEIELPDGQIVKGYLQLNEPDFAMVVPVDTSGRIGLIRCYKHGVCGIDTQPPAGYLEPGEKPLATAKRELLEETGCIAADWHRLGDYIISGNRGSGRAHIFLAMNCRQVDEPASGDLEEIEMVWLNFQEVYQRYRRGDFHQIATMAALGLALDWLKQDK